MGATKSSGGLNDLNDINNTYTQQHRTFRFTAVPSPCPRVAPHGESSPQLVPMKATSSRLRTRTTFYGCTPRSRTGPVDVRS
jgi:hypothetical protein